MVVKALPTGFPAEDMYMGLVPFLTDSQRWNARKLERNKHVGPLDIWTDSSGSFVKTRVHSQDPKRREVSDYPVTIFFGGNVFKKRRVQEQLMQTTEWRLCIEGAVGGKEKLLEKLDELYPVVPTRRMGHGAWADYVRGGCDCFLWHYKRQQNSHESPIHCTHSCAVMVKLAYSTWSSRTRGCWASCMGSTPPLPTWLQLLRGRHPCRWRQRVSTLLRPQMKILRRRSPPHPRRSRRSSRAPPLTIP